MGAQITKKKEELYNIFYKGILLQQDKVVTGSFPYLLCWVFPVSMYLLLIER